MNRTAALVSTTVLTQQFSLDSLNIPKDTLYHLIPPYDIKIIKIQNSWLIVKQILQKKLSSQKIIDIGLSYYQQESGKIFCGRYIFYDNNLIGIRIDTSNQPIWPRHYMKKVKIPQILQQFLGNRNQKEFVVGEFSLAFLNCSIAFMFGGQFRQGSLYAQYASYAYDIIVLSDQTQQIDFKQKLIQISQQNKTNFIYSNVQLKQKQKWIIGGASIIQAGIQVKNLQPFTLFKNPYVINKIDVMKVQLLRNPTFIPDGPLLQIQRVILYNSSKRRPMFYKPYDPLFQQQTSILKLDDILFRYKMQIWYYYQKNQFVPFVIQWCDNPKYIVFMYLLHSLALQIMEKMTLQQQQLLISRPIKNTILKQMLIVYSTGDFKIDNLDFMQKIKRDLGNNFVQVANHQNLAITSKMGKILQFIENTLPISLTITNNSPRYLVYTDNKALITLLKYMNQLQQNIIFCAIQLFDVEEVKIIYKQFLPKVGNGIDTLLKNIQLNYLKSLPIENQLFKYFNSLQLDRELSSSSQINSSFNPLKFRQSLLQRPDFKKQYIETLQGTYIPKLLSTPVQKDLPQTNYFLFTRAAIKDFINPLQQLNDSNLAINLDFSLRSIKDYTQQIIKLTQIQRKCHRCNYGFTSQLGITCKTESCNKFYCFKCLNQHYKRFDQVCNLKKLQDCPACIRQCTCARCSKATKIIKNTKKSNENYLQLQNVGNKISSKLPCHLCKQTENIIRSVCQNCTIGIFCLKCLKKNFNIHRTQPFQQWTCFICKELCVCQSCELKKAGKLINKKGSSLQQFDQILKMKEQQRERERQRKMEIQKEENKKDSQNKLKQKQVQENFNNCFNNKIDQGKAKNNNLTSLQRQYGKYFKKPISENLTFQQKYKVTSKQIQSQNLLNSSKKNQQIKKYGIKQKINSIWNQDDSFQTHNKPIINNINYKNYTTNPTNSYPASNIRLYRSTIDSYAVNNYPPNNFNQSYITKNNNSFMDNNIKSNRIIGNYGSFIDRQNQIHGNSRNMIQNQREMRNNNYNNKSYSRDQNLQNNYNNNKKWNKNEDINSNQRINNRYNNWGGSNYNASNSYDSNNNSISNKWNKQRWGNQQQGNKQSQTITMNNSNHYNNRYNNNNNNNNNNNRQDYGKKRDPRTFNNQQYNKKSYGSNQVENNISELTENAGSNNNNIFNTIIPLENKPTQQDIDY